MIPFINEEGALEIPFLENIEIVANNNNSAMILKTISRKDSMQSTTTNQKA